MNQKQIKKFTGLFVLTLVCLVVGSSSIQIIGASPTDINLTAYLRLNETSGQTANDSSTYDNDGTLGSTTGADANDPSWTTGVFGNALDFDGADDYVNLGNNPELNNQGPMTWETWINPRSTGEGYGDSPKGRIIDKGTKKLFVEDDYSRNIGFGVSGDSLTYRTTANNAFNLNEWSHVVLTWDGTNDYTNIHIYVNGVEASYKRGANGSNPANDSAYDMIVGNTIETDRAFDGKIDEVKIYDRALSAEEVSENYNRDNLTAYLRLNETSGQTANDSSTYDNDGTLGSTTGADANDPSWTTGVFGNALDFDGADDYVNLGNNPELNNQGPMTWETWINPRSTGEGYGDSPKGRIIDKGTKKLFVEDDYSRNIGFGVSGDSLTYRTTANNAFNLNEWSHVVLTWDGTNDYTNIHIYVNGVEASYKRGANGSNPANDSAYDMIVGNTIETDRAFDGKIDEVKIYDRALSAEEVSENYNRDNLTAYLRLNETSGQTANDSSTYDNDGTLGSTTGADANDPSWTTGVFGNALDFDGADDYVNLGNNPELNNQGPMTWETWINPRSTGEGYGDSPKGRIIDKGTKKLFVEDDYSRNIGFGVSGDSLTYRTTANNAFNLNEWSHVVLTWDGTNDYTNIHIYVNGVEASYKRGANGSNPANDSAYDMIVGNTIETDRAFDGKIDEVKIYDRALSAEEVSENYNRDNLTAGDLDGDEIVTINDYRILRVAFGSQEGDENWNPDCDFDGDGVVSLIDYKIWCSYYYDYNN